MTNAAIAFYADAFDAQAGKLMGRQSAGESFLRGFLRHADVERFTFWNCENTSLEAHKALLERIEPGHRPVDWLAKAEFGRVSRVGGVFVAAPANPQEAWTRRLLGSRAYSITGITHTLSSGWIMDALAQLMLAPVEPWDALICTSRAARSIAIAMGMGCILAWALKRPT
jgi:hypothetical protein